MARKVTLFTGQWADLPLAELAKKMAAFGYDGLELACWGDHFDLKLGAESKTYCDEKKGLLAQHGLGIWAISNHLAGQLICDPNFDARSDGFAPKELAGNAEAKRQWGIQQMKYAAKAARNLGIDVVNGFTGSPIWHMIYSFPPTSKQMIAEGFDYFARTFNPVLDVFKENGVRFALEVHPTEIAFDIVTAARTLDVLKRRPEFGFNFDPSHLVWQMVCPVRFLREFNDRIYHVHVKDAKVTLDGKTGILASHLDFDEPGRGWNFRSPGHGDVNFEEIIRELNLINYQGPLSVEWEDCGMDREFGAADACKFVRGMDFASSKLQFDAAFSKGRKNSRKRRRGLSPPSPRLITEFSKPHWRCPTRIRPITGRSASRRRLLRASNTKVIVISRSSMIRATTVSTTVFPAPPMNSTRLWATPKRNRGTSSSKSVWDFWSVFRRNRAPRSMRTRCGNAPRTKFLPGARTS